MDFSTFGNVLLRISDTENRYCTKKKKLSMNFKNRKRRTRKAQRLSHTVTMVVITKNLNQLIK